LKQWTGLRVQQSTLLPYSSSGSTENPNVFVKGR
jgi:hypothetical protein